MALMFIYSRVTQNNLVVLFYKITSCFPRLFLPEYYLKIYCFLLKYHQLFATEIPVKIDPVVSNICWNKYTNMVKTVFVGSMFCNLVLFYLSIEIYIIIYPLVDS